MEASNTATDPLSELQSRVEDYTKTHPWTTLAVAFGVGVGVGISRLSGLVPRVLAQGAQAAVGTGGNFRSDFFSAASKAVREELGSFLSHGSRSLASRPA